AREEVGTEEGVVPDWRQRHHQIEREDRVNDCVGQDHGWCKTPNGARGQFDAGRRLGPAHCIVPLRAADEPDTEQRHQQETTGVALEEKWHVQPRGLLWQWVADPREENLATRKECPEEKKPKRQEAGKPLRKPINARGAPTGLREVQRGRHYHAALRDPEPEEEIYQERFPRARRGTTRQRDTEARSADQHERRAICNHHALKRAGHRILSFPCSSRRYRTSSHRSSGDMASP